jgi:hypothetical protein
VAAAPKAAGSRGTASARGGAKGEAASRGEVKEGAASTGSVSVSRIFFSRETSRSSSRRARDEREITHRKAMKERKNARVKKKPVIISF